MSTPTIDPIISFLCKLEKSEAFSATDQSRAKAELERIKSKININSNHKQRLEVIKRCMEIPGLPQSEVNDAIIVHYKYISPFYTEERRTGNVQNMPQAYDRNNGADLDRRKQPLTSPGLPKHKPDPSNINTDLPTPDASWWTDDPREIGEKFQAMFHGIWRKTFSDLKPMPSEEKIHTVLLEIAQKAYDFCAKEKEQLVMQMQLCVVETFNLGTKVSSDSSVLETFLQTNCHLAMPRLQEAFRREKLDSTAQKHKVKSEIRSLEPYTVDCLRMTWNMVMADPPVHMVYGKAGVTMDEELYDRYQGSSQRSGRKIDHVIWPALLEYKDGPILMKGVAQC